MILAQLSRGCRELPLFDSLWRGAGAPPAPPPLGPFATPAPPCTRGVHATGYRGKPWTMRMFAGFGSAQETNARFKYLLSQGQSGLSIAFDLPTLMGYDTDAPQAGGGVGQR